MKVAMKKSEEVSEYVGYWISADGRILDRKTGTVLPIYSSGVVRLRKENGRYDTPSAHRLIAEAFVEKPEGANFVKFLDGNVGNRAARNLEWVIGVRPVSEKSREIVGLKLDGMSSVEIAELIDCTPQYVNRVLKDHRKRMALGNEHQA